MEGCGAELINEKYYYLRYHICRLHCAAPCLLINGEQERFCQVGVGKGHA